MNAKGMIRRERTAAVRLLFGCCAVMCAVAPGCNSASTTDPDPPSGGHTYVMSYSVFATQIDPILTNFGCDNTNCHGGGIRGTFELSPSNDKDVALDYEQASMQVNPVTPQYSLLLTKPMSRECGGLPHAGGSAFANFDDPDYQAILAWIEAGEYQ